MQLASGTHIPDGLLAANALLSEKLHQGFAAPTHTLHQSFRFAISSTSLGIKGSLYDTRIGCRYTGKERDAESGNDYFGARYYSSSMGRFLSPDWSAKEEPVPYAKLDNPQTLNLYQYMRNNPLGGVDPDGHSTLVFDGKTDTVTVYSKDGVKLGTFPAYNNVDSHATIGKFVNGTYSMEDTTTPHLHQGADAKENGSIGPGGIFRMKPFKGADGKMHSGVGVHAGRADTPDARGRSGPEHATEGCIRTNDAGIAKITATAKTDPLTSTTVENNRTPPPTPQKPPQSQTPQ